MTLRNIFITGTDTNVGKTLISAWLCMKFGYHYYKPIQSGYDPETDTECVKRLAGTTVYPEYYKFKAPVSPHLAAKFENKSININKISLPSSSNLIIEGAGGILTPLNKRETILDLINYLQVPVIIVARAQLGTINHTCLTIKSMRAAGIELLGVIMTGEVDLDNRDAIEHYGQTSVLAMIPRLKAVNMQTLQSIQASAELVRVVT